MREKRLLATDLDGTFIGDDESMFALWKRLEQEGVIIAFSTGRHLPSIEAFYEQKQADRRADACICMVGTDIWLREDGEYELDRRWHEIIREGWDKQRVETILQSIPEAQMQEEQWQSDFKSSYFLEQNARPRLAEIRRKLDEAGRKAKIVYSADKFLDLLPIRSGKGEAVKYLARRLEVRPENVVTCGDTGNDLDMMRAELGFRSIAVGNAADELRAFRQPHVYHARAAFAAGVREGLERFGWL